MTLNFDRIKQSDNIYKPSLSATYYSYVGDIVNLTTASIPSGMLSMGQRRAMLYKHSLGFRKGEFRENEIDQRVVNLGCPSGVVDVWQYVSGKSGPIRLNRSFSGPVAACMCNPLIDQGPIAIPADYGRLLQKAYSKLLKPDADVGQLIGEMSQTINMLRNPIRAFGAATKRFNKVLDGIGKPKPKTPKKRPPGWNPGWESRAKREARKYVDSVADARLTYQYGIMPVIRDFEAIKKKLDSQLGVNLGIRKRTSSITDVSNPVRGINGWTYWNGVYFYVTQTDTVMVKDSASVYYSVLMPYRQKITEYGLDVNQAIRLGYNLLPYTFVLDWIVDFDTWLGAILPKTNIHIYGNTVSKQTRSYRTFDVSATWLYGYGPAMPASNSHSSTCSKYLRDKDLPMSGLPAIRWPLDRFEKSLDAVSLLWQQMPRPYQHYKIKR